MYKLLQKRQNIQMQAWGFKDDQKYELYLLRAIVILYSVELSSTYCLELLGSFWLLLWWWV